MRKTFQTAIIKMFKDSKQVDQKKYKHFEIEEFMKSFECNNRYENTMFDILTPNF